MIRGQELEFLTPAEANKTQQIDALVLRLLALPDEAFSRLKQLQPEIGCFNRCVFCSQRAGKEVWHLTAESLQVLIRAIGETAKMKFPERAGAGVPLIGFERTEHKQGVIYPYLDNDIGSYPHLDQYIELLATELNALTRISTVGYSRHNTQLQQMHENIATHLADAVDGIRFSFTPYTYAFTQTEGTHGDASRAEYIKDFANVLRTYKPFIEKKGMGRDTACVEMRFRPAVFLESEGVIETIIEGCYIIKSGAYAIISEVPIELSTITELEGKTPMFNKSKVDATLLQSDSLRSQEWPHIISEFISKRTQKADARDEAISASSVVVYAIKNADGPYYVIDPYFKEDGMYQAVQIYPQTSTRTVAGVIDSSRYFLNTLLAYKKERRIARREKFLDATWDDVAAVVESLYAQAQKLLSINKKLADYILNNVYPMVVAYRDALKLAEYEPSFFFDRDFSVDTGQVVNQGRAMSEFGGLASMPDLPMTANEEKGYGEQRYSTQRGYIWRWSPSPHAVGGLSKAVLGGKNVPSQEVNSMSISQLDWHDLTPFKPSGEPLLQFKVAGVELERVALVAASELLLFPGLMAESDQ